MITAQLTNENLVDIFWNKDYEFLNSFTLNPNINVNFIVNPKYMELIDCGDKYDEMNNIDDYTDLIFVSALVEHYFIFPNILLKEIILRIFNHSSFDIEFKDETENDILFWCNTMLNDKRNNNVHKAFVIQLKTIVLVIMNRKFTQEKERFVNTLNRGEKRQIFEDLDIIIPRREIKRRIIIQ